jgi:hypothetical protein
VIDPLLPTCDYPNASVLHARHEVEPRSIKLLVKTSTRHRTDPSQRLEKIHCAC